MKKRSLFACLFLILILQACAQSDEKRFETIEFKDLAYVKHGDLTQQLNLVIPKDTQDFPLFIWIGGGAWSYVDRHVEMDLARQFGQQGIAVASLGHRLSPATWKDPSLNTGVQHPKHIEDIAAAVKWLIDHAATYGYDSRQLFIGGYSSGAHLAALLCLDGRYLEAKGLSTDIFQGMIPISGAYDIVNYHEVFLNGDRPELADLHVKAVFGQTEKEMYDASPTTYLQNLSTPILLISDNSIINYTKLFEAKIKEKGFQQIEVVYAHSFSHAELWKNMSKEKNSIYRDRIKNFIISQSKS